MPAPEPPRPSSLSPAPTCRTGRIRRTGGWARARPLLNDPRGGLISDCQPHGGSGRLLEETDNAPAGPPTIYWAASRVPRGGLWGPGAGLEASAPPSAGEGTPSYGVTRGGAARIHTPAHASFFPFNIRSLGHPISLCLFLSLLGFGFCPLCPAQSPPAPSPPKLDSRCQLPLLSLLLLANSSQFSLPPSFPKVYTWLASLMHQLEPFTSLCYLISG